MQVLDILETLEADGSRLAKDEILEENIGNRLLCRTLRAALDPYVNYGIAKFRMPIPAVAWTSQTLNDAETGEELGGRDLAFHDFIVELLPRLARRELRGNEARDAVVNAMSRLDAVGQKWAKRVLVKNLRAGIQAKTVNKVWPDLIPGFAVMLAYPLETSHDGDQIHIDGEVNYPVRVEPKLDGLRCVAIKSNGEVSLFTRNGREIDTLPAIKAALEHAPYDNIVLDGEAMGEDWNESSSIIGSKKNKKDDSNIFLNVFDAVFLEDWASQESEAPLSQRVGTVRSTVLCCPSGGPIRVVEGKTVKSEEELMAFYEQCLDEGYEGIMLKDLDAPYEFKRTRTLRKMKPVTTYEGTIVAWYPGREGTSLEHNFGGFTILLDNGVCSNCGGGFDLPTRSGLMVELTRDPNAYQGRIIEVEGQPPLTKDGRVRFPVFKRYRDPSDVDPKVVEAYEAWMQSDRVPVIPEV